MLFQQVRGEEELLPLSYKGLARKYTVEEPRKERRTQRHLCGFFFLAPVLRSL